MGPFLGTPFLIYNDFSRCYYVEPCENLNLTILPSNSRCFVVNVTNVAGAQYLLADDHQRIKGGCQSCMYHSYEFHEIISDSLNHFYACDNEPWILIPSNYHVFQIGI